MTTIVHRTPGLLDTRAFTVMGMSAKPGTNTPIGQFGTGLKYSIAGLLRRGAQVSIWIGREHWQFETSTEDFRGAEFTRIHAWVRSWGGLRRRRVELPFTTQLGPHWTWWMWLRELHSNTLDEGGSTIATDGNVGTEQDPRFLYYDDTDHDECHIMAYDDTTLIVIDHPDYAAAWEDRDRVFLPGATGPSGASGRILEAIPGSSSTLYYRGLRVLELRNPTVTCTWNILETTPLTEDRTMHEFYARAAIARWLVRECWDEDLITSVLDADDDDWESGLDFPHHVRPSDTFERAARRLRRPTQRLGSYLLGWAPPAPPDTRPLLERRGRRWQLVEEDLLDEHGTVVMVRPESLSQEDWQEVASTLVAAIAPRPEGVCHACGRPDHVPPARKMVAWDLYAGLEHDWSDMSDTCTNCGAVYAYDVRYSPCTPPEWMDQSDDPDPSLEPETDLEDDEVIF